MLLYPTRPPLSSQMSTLLSHIPATPTHSSSLSILITLIYLQSSSNPYLSSLITLKYLLSSFTPPFSISFSFYPLQYLRYPLIQFLPFYIPIIHIRCHIPLFLCSNSLHHCPLRCPLFLIISLLSYDKFPS
jgi:hypothetical protein